MPDSPSVYAQLPPDDQPGWLAKNRTFVILGSIVVILIVVVAVVALKRAPAAPSAQTANSHQSATTNQATTRSTFERSWAVNAPTQSIPTYPPPTNQDLQQAITNLQAQQSTNTKP